MTQGYQALRMEGQGKQRGEVGEGFTRIKEQGSTKLDARKPNRG